MSSKQTITINGKAFDAHTGLLAANQPEKSTQAPGLNQEKAATHSSSIHTAVQKSQTLRRTLTKKTAALKPQASEIGDIVRVRKVISKSPQISRFAAHPVVARLSQTSSSDIIGVKHPALIRAQQAQKAAKNNPAKSQVQSSQTIKQEALSTALSLSSNHSQQKKPGLKKRFPHLFSVASASLAILILAGYLTYLNMPTISIRVAAAGAGIDATYPDYRPDGYSLAGPIAYKNGDVTIQFAANAGPQNFAINEKKSPWDSSAVLENYVKPKIGGDYVEHNKNGLTIYTYDSDAAWVNGGILYTINGDAPLSTDQIVRIATSL
ncbi:MAG: hypothetical protein ABJA64_00435 [Candidatus Saccharibacteria bacterium]